MMQHELYKEVFKVASSIAKTVDSLENKNLDYPFIYVGETMSTDQSTTEITETVYITVHIYGRRTQRPEIAEIMAKLHDRLIKIRSNDFYYMRLTNHSTQVLPDNTDTPPLIHSVMDCTFLMTRRDI